MIIPDDGKRDYGNTVFTQDDLGNRFGYKHLKSVEGLRVGQELEPFAPFAEIGNTGFSSSAHLHYDMYKPGFGYMGASTTIDPTPYVNKYGHPCATIITNPYGSKICNPKLDSHEGIDYDDEILRQ